MHLFYLLTIDGQIGYFCRYCKCRMNEAPVVCRGDLQTPPESKPQSPAGGKA